MPKDHLAKLTVDLILESKLLPNVTDCVRMWIAYYYIFLRFN